jgi:CRISPR/Cas system CMR subunit Cmr6 (Cas7 group RAMP superfamily)
MYLYISSQVLNEVFSIASTASLTMLILDYFSEPTGVGARLGAGYGIIKGMSV